MLVKTAIRMAVPLPKVESFDRYLFVGPHPDDIEIGAGATVRKLMDAGKQITFLICTDGRYGDGASGGVTGDALAALRRTESLASAAKLGVTDVRFLDLEDGAGYSATALEQGLAETIANVRPDLVFAPDPDSKSECHADHLAVGNAVKKLVCFAPYGSLMRARYGTEPAPVRGVAFYMTARPNRFVKTGGRLAAQLSAIFDCHVSQYPAGSAEADALRLYLRLRSLQFGLRTVSRGAEGFRVLGQTHLHCLPESGEIG
ncbi:MAG: PIG-L family deacetylase [Clostridia bacterium]|nr:PIG-L family deacetylase [Clostridia bacterium]